MLYARYVLSYILYCETTTKTRVCVDHLPCAVYSVMQHVHYRPHTHAPHMMCGHLLSHLAIAAKQPQRQAWGSHPVGDLLQVGLGGGGKRERENPSSKRSIQRSHTWDRDNSLGTRNNQSGTWNNSPGTWNNQSGTGNNSPGTWNNSPGTWNNSSGTWDNRCGTETAN